MSQHAPIVKVGDEIAGKYRVERILGQGAMGMVVAAMHIELEERRAIKFMLPSLLGNTEGVERFVREAKACAKLKSKHIATVYDVGRLDNQARYIVMEYLEGTDLKDLLKLRAVLPVDEAVGYLLQACEAIGEAHQRGVVHRDLKPANMFLTAGVGGAPCIKVLDFGIAKVAAAPGDVEVQEMTATQAVMGSPLYMSPEQVRSSKDVDPRSDIWSLGVILFRMVVGALPFQAPTSAELFVKILADKPPVPSRINPRVPTGMDEIILRCLERDPARRFQSVAELVVALRPFSDPQVAKELDGTTHLWSGPVAPTSSSPTSGGLGNMTSSLSKSPGGTIMFPPAADAPRPQMQSVSTIQGLAPTPSPIPNLGATAETAVQPVSQASSRSAQGSTVVMSPQSSPTMPSAGSTHSPVTAASSADASVSQGMAPASGGISNRGRESRNLGMAIAVGAVAFLAVAIALILFLRGNNSDSDQQTVHAQTTTKASAKELPPGNPAPTATVASPAVPTVTSIPTVAASAQSPPEQSTAATTQQTAPAPRPTASPHTTSTKPSRHDDIFGDGKRK